MEPTHVVGDGADARGSRRTLDGAVVVSVMYEDLEVRRGTPKP